jgi:hypothetical protein
LAPAPAVIAQRWNATFCEPLTKTAMLDGALLVPGCAVNAKSQKLTPAVKPLTDSAYPTDDGATVATLLALYVHCAAEQSSPPYTVTPSRDEATARFSA